MHRRAIPLLLAASVAFAGDAGGRAHYIGGTLAAFKGKTDGIIYTTYEDSLFFQTKRTTVRVPYEQINLLEYG